MTHNIVERLRVAAMFHDSGHDETDDSRLMRDAAAEIEKLRDLVYALSDALTDEGPSWSDTGLLRLRCRAARELPKVEWLQPYLGAEAQP